MGMANMFPFGWMLAILFLIYLPINYCLVKLFNIKRTSVNGFEILLPSQIRKRLPGFNISNFTLGFYYLEAGTLHAEQCVQWLQHSGEKNGGKIRDCSPVED